MEYKLKVERGVKNAIIGCALGLVSLVSIAASNQPVVAQSRYSDIEKKVSIQAGCGYEFGLTGTNAYGLCSRDGKYFECEKNLACEEAARRLGIYLEGPEPLITPEEPRYKQVGDKYTLKDENGIIWTCTDNRGPDGQILRECSN